jgi:uncharacterized DUF497 family protein
MDPSAFLRTPEAGGPILKTLPCLISRYRLSLQPNTLAAGTAYGSGGMLGCLMERGIEQFGRRMIRPVSARYMHAKEIRIYEAQSS